MAPSSTYRWGVPSSQHTEADLEVAPQAHPKVIRVVEAQPFAVESMAWFRGQKEKVKISTWDDLPMAPPKALGQAGARSHGPGQQGACSLDYNHVAGRQRLLRVMVGKRHEGHRPREGKWRLMM